ncbi:MAG: ankyrin repeat domain-containing protein [Wolbachia sp.]
MADNLTYEKIKEIVTNNHDITAEELRKEKIDIKITNQDNWTLLYYAVRSEVPYITGGRSIFLKVVKLLNSGIKVNGIQDTAYTLLDRAVITKQADIVKILLESGKFNEKEKLQALNSAIVQGNIQEFEVFLDYIDHAKILEALNKASCDENTDIMKVLLDNKRLTEEEKANALSNAFVDGGLPKVRLLLKYMTGIPANGIINLLEMIKESKSPFEEELRTNSEFKVDFDNSDHYEYLSNCVIIALLRSAINKKEGQTYPMQKKIMG